MKQFTKQVNDVATLVLNDGIALSKANTYSALARTVAQSVNAEIQKARMLRRVPDLNFDEEEG